MHGRDSSSDPAAGQPRVAPARARVRADERPSVPPLALNLPRLTLRPAQLPVRPSTPIRPEQPNIAAPAPAPVAAPASVPAPAAAPVATPAPLRPPLQAGAAPAIEVRGLVKQYGANGPRVVDGIDITVAPGEIYGFLGPNGAGKSTTVNMLVTLLPPSGGSARIAGHDVATQGNEVRRHIGAALQAVALDPFLTPREHLRLVASLHGMSPAQSAPRVEQLLERVGLTDVGDKRCGGFSGGMKRRLDLALALVHGPSVLFLDEPTTGLDPQSRTALWGEVRRLAWEERVTVFLTTQYLEEADQLADRIGIIVNGRIVAEDTPDALKAQIGTPTVEVTPTPATDGAQLTAVLERFGTPVPPRAAGRIAIRLDARHAATSLVDVVRALDEGRVPVGEVRIHEPSLDDVFLAHTGRSLEGAARR